MNLLPLKHIFFSSLKTGKFLSWNPYYYGGMSLIGDPQGAFLYPVEFVLFYFFSIVRAFHVSIFFHLLLLGSGTYIWLSSVFRVSGAAAFLGALITVFNLHITGHVYGGHINYVNGLAWMPVILTCFHFLWTTKKIFSGYFVMAVTGLTLQIYAGHFQTTYMTALLLGMILLLQYPLKDAGRRVMKSFIVLLFVTGLSAPLLLPFYSTASQSARWYFLKQIEWASSGGFYPRSFLTFFFPLIFGTPSPGTMWPGLLTGDFHEQMSYAGIGFILPVLYTFFSRGGAEQKRKFLMWILISAFFVFISVGKYSPLYRVFYYILPGFSNMRAPARFVFPAFVCVLPLFATGVDKWRNDVPRSNDKRFIGTVFICFLLLAGIGLILANLNLWHGKVISETAKHAAKSYLGFLFVTAFLFVLVFTVRISKKMKVTLFILLCVFDLYYHTRCFIVTADAKTELNVPSYNYLKTVKNKTGDFRVATGPRIVLPNIPAVYGLSNITGYTQLIPRDTLAYLMEIPGSVYNPIGGIMFYRNFNSTLLDLLNVRFIISLDTKKNAVRLIERKRELKTAYISHKIVRVDTPREMYKRLPKETNPYNRVYLYKKDTSGLNIKRDTADVDDKIEWKKNDIEEKILGTTTSTGGILTLSYVMDRGWRGFIDGKEVPLFRGNGMFISLLLPAGNHLVRIVYRAPFFRVGVIIFITTLCLVILATFICHYRV